MAQPLLIIAFGSQVTGKANSASDFDFGVLAENGKQLSLEERADVSAHIAKKCAINEDRIDLVDLSTVSPMLKFEVARTGKMIEGDAFDFIRFKVRAFKEYTDTAKFRRIRESVMM